MKVENIKNNTPSFQGIYNNKLLKKGLLYAAQNGTLFSGAVMLGFSTAVRPLVILATPNTDKKNKEYACTKSIASSLTKFLVMLGASIPIAKSISNIDSNPSKYLKDATIKNLQGAEKVLTHSKKYAFATQLFKVGAGLLIAAPAALLTSSLIPAVMSKIFPDKKQENIMKSSSQPSFCGKAPFEKLSKIIGQLIDSKAVQGLTNKFHNSKFELNIMSLTDAVSTATFAYITKISKKIDETRKNPLIYNAVIATGLSIAGGYTLDKLLEKPIEKFIRKFTQANKASANLHKYIEGIKIAKAALLLGSIYYIVIPLISTFAADRIGKIPDKSPKTQ